MRAILALEDGTWFQGHSFTGIEEAEGEVIFNTGMTGYQEILTDPSYVGQLVCMTYPLMGNYGINPQDMESEKVQVAGFITKECCRTPSNWRATKSLPDYLQENQVLGVEGIDTRALTTHIRKRGAMRGFISTREEDPAALVRRANEIPRMEGLNLAEKAGCSQPFRWTQEGPKQAEINSDGSYDWPDGGPRVLVYDYGIKWNILRLLKAQGLELLVVPWNFGPEQVSRVNPDGVFLSNGPGDPAAISQSMDIVSELLEKYPIAGICLGHQILGLALGGKSFKLKFGHHGMNHPVQDLSTRKIEISSQNHGFCVQVDHLDFLEQTHINLNDRTLEGFRHKTKPIMGIQYHPEAASGPHDSRYFFTRYREMVQKG